MGTQLHQIYVKQAAALSQTPKNCQAEFSSCSKTFQNPIPSQFTALPGCPHGLGCADCCGEYQDEGSTVCAFQELLQERLTQMQVTTVNRVNPAKCYPWEQAWRQKNGHSGGEALEWGTSGRHPRGDAVGADP